MGSEALIGSILVPDIEAPRACDVDLEFMRYRLGRIVRFSGFPGALTVDEHQRLVAVLAEMHGEPAGVVRWCCYHDAHEFALGDTIAPIKAALRDVMHRIEAAWDAAIAAAVGIPLPTVQERGRVSIYDRLALRIEWRWVLGRDPQQLALPAGLPSTGMDEAGAFAVIARALGSSRAAAIFERAAHPETFRAPRRPRPDDARLVAYQDHRRLWSLVEGAVVDAMQTHPEYFTAAARAWAVSSITKRVVGQLVGNAKGARKRGLDVHAQPVVAVAEGSATACRSSAASGGRN